MLRKAAVGLLAALSSWQALAVQLSEHYESLVPSTENATSDTLSLDEIGGAPRRRKGGAPRRRRARPIQAFDCYNADDRGKRPLSIKEVCAKPGSVTPDDDNDGGGYTPTAKPTPRRRRAKNNNGGGYNGGGNAVPRRRRAKNGGGGGYAGGGNQAVPRRRRAKNGGGGGGGYAGGGQQSVPRRRRAKNAGGGGGGGYAGGGGYVGAAAQGNGGGFVALNAIGAVGAGAGGGGGGYAGGGAATPRRRRAKNGGGGGYAGGNTPRRRRAKNGGGGNAPRRRKAGGGGGGGGDYEEEVCKSSVSVYNTETGKNDKLFDVPANGEGKYVVSACALNPSDDKLYCVLDNYVSRMDSKAIRYVAKLAAYTKAIAFDSAGNFYYEGQGYKGLYKIPSEPGQQKLDALQDYENKGDNMANHEEDDEIAESVSGALDMLLVKRNWEGDGEKEYLVALDVNWDVGVVRVNDPQVKKWTLKTSGDKEGTPMGFGKGWSLENRVFFSEDSGLGTFEIENIDLKAKTATLALREPSETVGQDKKASGTQCQEAKVPERWTKRAPSPPRSGTIAPPSKEAPPGECLAGMVKKPACGCASTVRCQKAKTS